MGRGVSLGRGVTVGVEVGIATVIVAVGAGVSVGVSLIAGSVPITLRSPGSSGKVGVAVKNNAAWVGDVVGSILVLVSPLDNPDRVGIGVPALSRVNV